MEWIKHIERFVILFLLQWLLFNHLLIAGACFPMVYILVLIGFPTNIKRWQEVIIGCVVGLLMDILYSSPGVHMGACTALSFIRPIILGRILQDVERLKQGVSISTIGATDFAKCTILLTLVHHSMVFALESWSMHSWWLLLCKILISSVMTIAIIMVYEITKR